jgi:hypothetical protein
MGIIDILSLLLKYMQFKKAKSEDYDLLKKFVSESTFLKGKKKQIYTKINKHKRYLNK